MGKIKNKDEYWMHKALKEARNAMSEGELPIAAILVSGENEMLTRAQTQTGRRKSMVAHGELFALLDAREKVFTAEHPLTIYTTLEPCLMCIGAAMQCQIDEIVYAMPADPDGGSRFISAIIEGGQKPPEIRGNVLIEEEVSLMRQFIKENPNHFGIDYVKALLEAVS